MVPAFKVGVGHTTDLIQPKRFGWTNISSPEHFPSAPCLPSTISLTAPFSQEPKSEDEQWESHLRETFLQPVVQTGKPVILWHLLIPITYIQPNSSQVHSLPPISLPSLWTCFDCEYLSPGLLQQPPNWSPTTLFTLLYHVIFWLEIFQWLPVVQDAN